MRSHGFSFTTIIYSKQLTMRCQKWLVRCITGDWREPGCQLDQQRLGTERWCSHQRTASPRRQPDLPDYLQQRSLLPGHVPDAAGQPRLPQRQAHQRAQRHQAPDDDDVGGDVEAASTKAPQGRQHHAVRGRHRLRVHRLSDSGAVQPDLLGAVRARRPRMRTLSLLLHLAERRSRRRQLVVQLRHLLSLRRHVPTHLPGHRVRLLRLPGRQQRSRDGRRRRPARDGDDGGADRRGWRCGAVSAAGGGEATPVVRW